MDMVGVRNLVVAILNRNRQKLSNRQQLRIEHSLFNRDGAGPDILQAFLVRKCDCPSSCNFIDSSSADGFFSDAMMDRMKTAKKQDVTNEIVLEHERQIQITGS